MKPARKDAPNLDSVSILDASGHRKYVFPADVKGRFRSLKPWVFGGLVALWIGLPVVHIGGHPAVHIDLPARRFFLFGMTFNAQDVYMIFFLLTGIGFALIVMSALWGRVWCGWMCPQTVFLDGFFRQVERWIEGPAARRQRLADGPWTFEKIWKKGLKHAVYVVMAVGISVMFVSYFISVDGLGEMVREGIGAHPAGFAWIAVLSAVLYFNFWWFREQLCIVVCPYGRLQSALQDQHTVNVGYDVGRGEPRGKAKAQGRGDCVDCGRCVAVCPTGIDIRNGIQLECIGCAYCIDACDDIMVKVGQPKGLIRYDSEAGLTTGKRIFWRPRVFGYLAAALIGLLAAGLMGSQHEGDFEANLLRVQGAPFVITDASVENRVMVHVVNKHNEPATFSIAPATASSDEDSDDEGYGVLDAAAFQIPQREVTLGSFESHKFQVVITVPRAEYAYQRPLAVEVHDSLSGKTRTVTFKMLGPRKLAPPADKLAPPAAEVAP